MSLLLGRRIKSARLAQGFTQQKLADKVGVYQPQIAQWENGHAVPSETKLQALEKVLGSLPAKAPNDGVAIESTGTFGVWLRNARTALGMSVPELHIKSGVSATQIYNIERGKSPNPQAETKAKLAKALDTPIPEEVSLEAEEEQAIEGLGSLIDFDPYEKAARPTAPGIYVFYDVSDRPVYVGKGENIANRVKGHEEKFWFKWPIVSHAAYVKIQNEVVRHQIEQILIKFLKSNAVINIQSVDR